MKNNNTKSVREVDTTIHNPKLKNQNSNRPALWIDRFRIVAALLIVGIHTYPFSSISAEANFLIVNVFSRIAVPFFLMITGYFLLPRYLVEKVADKKPLISFLKKTGIVYAGATVLYLPISIYAGYYSGGFVVATLIRNILSDGTFYHLWYLPASIIGVLLLYFLGRRFEFRTLLIASIILYILGLLGDSYYGLVENAPAIRSLYDAGFRVFSYTRNGLFYAPVFLAVGAAIARMKTQIRPMLCAIGFSVSIAIMLVEGSALDRLGFQRHDSMYIMLIPSMFFLFAFLLGLKDKAEAADVGKLGTHRNKARRLRSISMWIYIIHPVFIIAVRGAARFAGLTEQIVENSIINYIAVCGLSVAFSIILTSIREAVTTNSSFNTHNS